MFSTSFAASRAHPLAFANTYRQVGVHTEVGNASPHRLIALLFDGFVEALAQARGALRNGQVETKCRAIGRAARIVDEGLRAALDLRAGGPMAADLNNLYSYLTMRLTHANLHNDEKALDECERLMQPLREAWQAIGPGADAQ